MPTLGLVGLLLVAVLCLAALAGRAAAGEKPAAPVASASPGAPMPARPLSRQELAQKLRELARSEPPKALSPGAECYKPAMPKDTAEYVCPKCGARTQYTKDRATAFLVDRELPGMRQQLKEIHGLEVALDESQLCRKCTPKAPDQPQVAVVVRHPDGAVARTAPARADDLRLLRELLDGSLKHAGSQDAESPLKEHRARLEELLGVQAEK